MTITKIRERVAAAEDSYLKALEAIQWNASGRSVRRSDQLNLYRDQLTYWERELARATGQDKAVVSVKPARL